MFHRLPRPLRLLPPALLLVAGCALVALGFPLPAQAATTGSGQAATETRSPGPFDAVHVAGSIDLLVRQASTPAVTVTADDNLLALIETVVDGGVLRVQFKRGESVRTRTSVRVAVDAVSLKALRLSGSGDLVLESFRTPKLDLSISGSGDAWLRELTADELSLRIAGSGDIKAAGSAARLQLGIAGSGDADLAALGARDVRVSIAGSGDARVHASDSLEVSVAGSGDVVYSGGATRVKSSVAGSGSVSAR